MNTPKSPTARFFLLNPTKEKIIVSFLYSLILIFISLIIPSMGFQSVFLGKELSGQIVSIIISSLFSFVVYYPFACGLVYIFKVVTGKEKMSAKNLVTAVLFMFIFNMATFSMIATKMMQKPKINIPPTVTLISPLLCGLQIIEVSAPSAKDAGLVVGEFIDSVNDYQVRDMNGLTHALANSRPGDTVKIATNINTYNVTLFADSQNPARALLGIKLNLIKCGK